MKKRLFAIVAALLAAVILTGCKGFEKFMNSSSSAEISSSSLSESVQSSEISSSSESTDTYKISVHINFTANLIFSTYDVKFSVDGAEQGTMKHGEDADFELSLAPGEHNLLFTKSDSPDVSGSAVLNADSDMKITYKISCHSDEIKVQEIEKEALGSADSSTESSSEEPIRSMPESSIEEPTSSSIKSSSEEFSSSSSTSSAEELTSSSTSSSEGVLEPVQSSSSSSSTSSSTSSSSSSTKPISTKPVQTAPEVTVAEIQLVSMTNPLRRNEDATITIKGKPNTEYSIAVYYQSGKSKAKGLENKVSNSSGVVSWTWHVGGKTQSGKKGIVINGGGQTLKLSFSVVDSY